MPLLVDDALDMEWGRVQDQRFHERGQLLAHHGIVGEHHCDRIDAAGHLRGGASRRLQLIGRQRPGARIGAREDRLLRVALEELLRRAERAEGRTLPLTEEARHALRAMADGDGRYVLNMAEELLPLQERANRMVLRNLKALADLRRAAAPSVAIGSAQQVNVGAQQVNVAQGSDRRKRAATVRGLRAGKRP